MKCSPARSSATAALVLTLCGCSTLPPASPLPGPSPLVVQNCQPLAPLTDDSFGAWVLWAQYAAGQYAKCSAAAFAQDSGHGSDSINAPRP